MRSISLAVALFVSLSAVVPANSHHGWGYYDTGRPLIFSAEVVEVEWTNPHPDVTIAVEAEWAAPDARELPVPPELAALGFEAIAAEAVQAAEGRYHLDLAPIGRLERWGLPRQPEVGDRILGVAFPSCTEEGVLRPVLIVLDGVGVRQQSVPLPAGCSGRPRGD